MAKKATTKIEETAAAKTEAPVEAAAEKKAEVKTEVKTEVKAEEKTAEPAKKTTRKTTAKKVEDAVKATAEKAEKAAKDTAEKVEKAVKKTTTKSTAKAAKPAAEAATDVYVQFLGKEIVCKDILARVKEIWKNDLGKKEEDLKDIKVYIKPEDNGAYYVINGDVTGFISL